MQGDPGRPRGDWVGSSQPQTADEAAHVSPDSLLPRPLAPVPHSNTAARSARVAEGARPGPGTPRTP